MKSAGQIVPHIIEAALLDHNAYSSATPQSSIVGPDWVSCQPRSGLHGRNRPASSKTTPVSRLLLTVQAIVQIIVLQAGDDLELVSVAVRMCGQPLRSPDFDVAFRLRYSSAVRSPNRDHHVNDWPESRREIPVRSAVTVSSVQLHAQLVNCIRLSGVVPEHLEKFLHEAARCTR